MRIGHGYDVHRFAPDRPLILGGEKIPFDRGLDGHSDADVLTHAVMDALLGAAGVRDIGSFFSDKDPTYKDISSMLLLKRVATIVRSAGYKISNIDVTVIAERPRLANYIDLMRFNLSKMLSIEFDDINIKATTEEGLGFTGEEKGIAAHAVCLLEKR